MKRLALLAALAVTTVIAAVPGEAQRRAAARPAAVQDWTRVAVRTPEGGFRLGNPNAPVKVIEYLSLACSHCAEFSAASHAALVQNYIRPGRVSIEYRHIVINAPDVPATMLARCAAPLAYFNMSRELWATQAQWIGRVAQIPQAQRAQFNGLSPLQTAQRLAPLIGLDRIAARHGLSPAQQRACLSSQANLDAINRIAEGGRNQYGVQGTPTFVINGRVVTDTNVWAGIEPLLRGR